MVAPCEKLGGERDDDPVDGAGMLVGVIGPAPHRPIGGLQRVGDLEHASGLEVRAPGVQDRGEGGNADEPGSRPLRGSVVEEAPASPESRVGQPAPRLFASR